MEPLSAFATTWSAARTTFGDGTPVDGTVLDGSAAQRGQALARAATPTAEWSGSGASAYSEANAAHVARLGAFADLDRRFGAEIGRSAEVVGASRRDLEALRKWVADAAAAAPNSTAGQRMLWSIVGKGVCDLQSVMSRSVVEQSEIASRIRALSGEYRQLGTAGDDAPDPVP